jgi:hypothetical protein
VLGDPLGRYGAIVELLGDCDADAVVDLADYAEFASCMTGPGGSVPLGCECADLDVDDDSDLDDFAGFQQSFGQSAL